MRRGYFLIGIHNGKTKENLGTLWRSAYQLGAAGIFTIGRRYSRQASDTYKTLRHVPMYEFDSIRDFGICRPHGAQLVAVEMGGEPIETFRHPQQAIYLLGSEDNGLPEALLLECQHRISLPAMQSRPVSYNVATAGALVMYDRYLKNTHGVFQP